MICLVVEYSFFFVVLIFCLLLTFLFFLLQTLMKHQNEKLKKYWYNTIVHYSLLIPVDVNLRSLVVPVPELVTKSLTVKYFLSFFFV